MQTIGMSKHWHKLAIVLVTSSCYYILGEAGLLLAIPPGYATGIFPAAAVAVVACLSQGLWAVPGIWLGSFAINLTVAANTPILDSQTVLVAGIIAVGACLQGLAASRLVQYRIQQAWQTLYQDTDIYWFLLLAGPVASLISSSWATLTLSLCKIIEPSEAVFTWWNWWVGDALGVLLFAPIFVILLQRQQETRQTRLRMVVVPTMLLALGMVVLFIYVSDKDRKLLQHRIDDFGNGITNTINLKLLTFQETVGALARLQLISPHLSHHDFQLFTQPIFSQHRDLHALSWNPLVKHAQRSAFEQRYAKENQLPQLLLTERDSQGRPVPAQQRDWYVAVGFIEPMLGNVKALGYDIASDADRLQGINTAMQTRQMTSTAPIRLVQDNNPLVGLLLLQPAYRDAQQALPDGFAVGVFRVQAMLARLVGENLPQGLSFQVEDLQAETGKRVIYSNSPQLGHYQAGTVWSTTLDFGGRKWQLTLAPDSNFMVAQRSLTAWLILAFGLIVVSLLQAILLTITGRTFFIQRIVEQQTQEITHKNSILMENAQTLRREKEKYETLMHASGDGIHILDKHGYVLEANAKFCELLGYCYDEVKGMHASQWEANFDFKQTEFIIRANFAHPTVFETQHRLKSGDIIAVEVSSKAVMIDDELVLWNASRDISERKRLEHELTEAKETAERLTLIKARFLANMSHEIRTPMNGIIGLTQLALQLEMTADLREYLTKIHFSAQTLLSIVNDILDLSKIDAQRMVLDHAAFNLYEVANAIQHLFHYSAAEKKLHFVLDVAPNIPSPLLGDAARIQQILTNLVGNAIKFTDHGEVKLSIGLVRVTAEAVELAFSVADTGIGIDAARASDLFSPFKQLDSSINRRFGGTGLGLAICRELLLLMGATIRFESELGVGTRFYFNLCLACVSQNPQQPVIPSAHNAESAETLKAYLAERQGCLRGRKLLVAEDNGINQMVVGNFLKLLGVAYDLANNGEEVLARLQQQDYDAILMDIGMPVMDGLAATRHIRAQPQWQELPILALSAGVTAEEREQCELAGMNAFVPKPINPKQFVDTLINCLPCAPT